MAKVTKDNYPIIVQMIKAEMPTRQIAKGFSVSTTTISRIKSSKDFEDYRRIASHDAKRSTKKASGNSSPAEVLENLPKTSEGALGKAISKANDTRLAMAMESLALSIDRIAELIESDRPLNKEARAFKLFNRD